MMQGELTGVGVLPSTEQLGMTKQAYLVRILSEQVHANKRQIFLAWSQNNF